MGPAVEGDDVAEEGFFRGEPRLLAHLGEDLLHFFEFLGSAELADDEIVGSRAVAVGLRVRVTVRVRVFEEFEGEIRVFLDSEKGGESKW